MWEWVGCSSGDDALWDELFGKEAEANDVSGMVDRLLEERREGRRAIGKALKALRETLVVAEQHGNSDSAKLVDVMEQVVVAVDALDHEGDEDEYMSGSG